jgi:predicted membrane channel-forming protein YqfA (hemolysin III family)
MHLHLIYHTLRFITDLGDLALLLPLAVVVGVTLWRYETPAASRAFALALVLCLGTLGALKLAFLSCGAAALGALIALSRIALHMHSAAEVVIGLAVGLTSLALFVLRYRGQPHRHINLLALGVVMTVTSVVAYGSQSPAEYVLHGLVYRLRAYTGLCMPEARTVAAPRLTRLPLPSMPVRHSSQLAATISASESLRP